MRIELHSFEALKSEILENINRIRGKVIRFTRADIPQQQATPQSPCLVFEHAVIVTLVIENENEADLVEMTMSYGVGAAINSAKAKETDQPSAIRESQLALFQQWVTSNTLKLRQGKIELF